MLKDCSRGYLPSCCYSKQLSMSLFHVSHPPAQTCGGEDIIYIYMYVWYIYAYICIYVYIHIYFLLILPENPEFWTPLQIPICPTPLAWLHPVTMAGSHFLGWYLSWQRSIITFCIYNIHLECQCNQGNFFFPDPSGHNLPPEQETTQSLTVIF